ncbi:MAG: deoxyguanosinetriphosphate triphosphohydrolase [Eubacteriaceae bacterium]|nr:deoxyguanosinetriphosphate triphosphohydrolase [Eubacteriaceae bacterium]
MNIREEKEKREEAYFSPYAKRSADSRGRELAEEQCPVRTCFERDRDRILYCKSFRRLKHKTQVFISPESDHLQTRLTHTLEVAQIARSIANALDLNESLAEAIALGHDLGHTPFGHSGESVLNELYDGGFEHNVQSLRVVEVLENSGRGLNLTWEVRDGILNHCSGLVSSTLEGRIVNISDKIAYINHDMEDALSMGILREEDFPGEFISVLGHSNSERINTMISDVIIQSRGINEIKKSAEVEAATDGMRAFLFRTLYVGSEAKREEEKAKNVVRTLYGYFLRYPEKMPEEYVSRGEEDMARSVCDYIAGMTDNYATELYRELFVPRSWF